MPETNIELGLGLIGIGREWGYLPTPMPDDNQVREFLIAAYNLNIRCYDTAPSYGRSEERLGSFLKSLSSDQRRELIIMSKFGEHWDNNKNCAYVDHSYDALCKSIDNSLALLGSIDILQLHKTTPAVLKNDSVVAALNYARSCGITTFGASVSDLESGSIVCDSNIYSYIQLPYNLNNMQFEELIDNCNYKGKQIIVNRPFWMGKLLHDNASSDLMFIQIEAFRYIIHKKFNGMILSGTKDIKHLEQNIKAFNHAKGV